MNTPKLATLVGIFFSVLLASPAQAARVERGNLVLEGIPDAPPALVEGLSRYQQARSAALQGFMPDGSVLLTTRFGETAQLHQVRQPMAARQQLTFYPEPIAGALPRPKHNGFVFSKDVGGNEFFQYHYYDAATRQVRLLTDGKSRNSAARFSHDGALMAFSTTKRNGKDTDIHIIPLDSPGPSVPLVEREGEWSTEDISPSGKQLVVSHAISATESELYLLDLASRALTRFNPTKTPVFYGDARFSADGKKLYYTSDEDTEFRVLRVADLASGKSQIIQAQPYWNVTSLHLSPKATRLAYVVNANGLSQLHLLELASGKTVAAPALPVGQVLGLEFDAAGRKVGFSLDAATSPADVYSFTFGEQKLTRWTQSEVGGLDSSKFIAPTLVQFKSFDAQTIPAFVYRPALAKGKLPVIINIHGGPESQATPGFNPIFQYYLSELGVAVITPNVRGSDGYGKSYLKLDNGLLREDSVKDIGALLDWIATQPDLDASRIMVTGGSYGGYMTLACMTHYNSRLRAGLDIVGISNFVTFLKNTQDYRRDLRRVEYGDERIPEMRAFMEQTAPLNNAQNITKPMFIVQGLNDPRVPASEAEQMEAKIRANGGVVWFMMAKDEGHGFRKKTNRDALAVATVQFLQQTLLAP